jgi:hypothetical protein
LEKLDLSWYRLDKKWGIDEILMRLLRALGKAQTGGGGWSVGFSNSCCVTKRNLYTLFEWLCAGQIADLHN